MAKTRNEYIDLAELDLDAAAKLEASHPAHVSYTARALVYATLAVAVKQSG
jgi:hypothetical protein